MGYARIVRFLLVLFVATATAGVWSARSASPVRAAPQAPDGKGVYDQIRAFSLSGGSAEVSGLTLKRDRAEMTFTGTFYFAAPVAGKVTGAVFVGDGRITRGRAAERLRARQPSPHDSAPSSSNPISSRSCSAGVTTRSA